MKILLINKFHYHHGGADSYYLALGERLEKLGHEVAYFAMRHPKNLPTPWSRFFISYREFSEIRRDPVYALTLIGRMIWSLEARRNLRRLLSEFQPDIAHIHNIYHHISPSILPLLKKRGIPVVMTAHDFKLIGPHYKLPPRHHLADRFFYTIKDRSMKDSLFASIAIVIETLVHHTMNIYPKNIDRLFTSSKFVSHLMREYTRFTDDQIVELALGVEQQQFVEFQERAGMLYVGRLSEGKGVEWLIDTWKALQLKEPLTIVGRGPLEATMREKATGLPITFTGFLPHAETLSLMARSRCLIAPSTIAETFGLAAMEALSVGTPVIASNQGALTEHIQHGYNGYLVDPMEPASLGKKIQAFLSDPLKERQMREHAVTSVKAYSWDYHLNALVEQYQELIRLRHPL